MTNVKTYVYAFLISSLLFGSSTEFVSANAATSVGLPANTLMTSGDQKLLFGGCSSDLWTYLKAHATQEADKGGGRSLVPRPGEAGIQSGLACRLYTFFKYMETQGCKPQIISAFRSAGVQSQICGPSGKSSGCAAPGRSCHQYGAAVDVGGCAEKMRGILKSVIGKSRFKLHFPYYGPHIQCVEHACASAKCCSDKNKPCGGGGPINFDEIPPEQNTPVSGTNGNQNNQDPTSQLAQNLNATEQNGVSGGSSSSGGDSSGSNPSYAGTQDIFAEPVAYTPTQVSQEDKQALFDCLLDDFGKCNEEQKESVNALLQEGDWEGAIEGEEGFSASDSEDTLTGGTESDVLSSGDASCADPGSSVSRNDASCLQVGGTGGSDQNTPILPELSGGQSAVATIRDAPTLSERLFGISSTTPSVDALDESGVWNNANQYVSFLYHRGDDAVPSNMYYDSYTQTYRYVGSNQEVPAGLVNFVFSDDAPITAVNSFSWDAVGRAALTVGRATLPSFGFTIPFTSLFSW